MALDSTQLNEVASLTTQHINDEVPDLFTAANALYKMSYDRRNYVPGGTFIQMPIFGVSELGSQGFISGTGNDNLNLNINQMFTYGQLNWKFFYYGTTFDLKELTVTMDSPHAVKNFVNAKVAAARQSMIRTLSSALHASDSVNTNSFTGMAAIFAASGTAYAGINDTDIANWLPYYPSSIPAANYTNLAPIFDTLRTRTQQDISGVLNPQDNVRYKYQVDLILSDATQYSNFKIAEQLKLRFTPSELMKSGFTSIQVDGIDWVVDTYSPASTIYVLTSDSFEMFYKYGFERKSPLNDTALRIPNQPVKVDLNFMAGNIGCTNRRVNSKVTIG